MSLRGKLVVIKHLALPIIMFTAPFIYMPKDIAKKLDTIFFFRQTGFYRSFPAVGIDYGRGPIAATALANVTARPPGIPRACALSFSFGSIPAQLSPVLCLFPIWLSIFGLVSVLPMSVSFPLMSRFVRVLCPACFAPFYWL